MERVSRVIKAPVLIIAHRRPERIKLMLQNKQLLERNVYLHVDGARNQEEAQSVQEVGEIALSYSKIHPNCKVKIQKSNLGVRRGPEFALDWAFSKTKALIILEDDIVVSPAFFDFCDFYLDKYENNFEIWQISGWTPISNDDSQGRNYLSHYTHIWGWATWRSRWTSNDKEFVHWKPGILKFSKCVKGMSWKDQFSDYWDAQVIQVLDGKQAWDTAWMVSMHLHDSLSVSPAFRHTGNVGFDETANNTEGITGKVFRELPNFENYQFDKTLDLQFSANLAEFHNERIFGIRNHVVDEELLSVNFASGRFLTWLKKFIPVRLKIKIKHALLYAMRIGG